MPGRGDYAAGQKIYAAACSACHGADLRGGARLADMPSGPALRLIGGRGTLTTKNPVMTGSLSADEVYAVTAYILGEAQILDKGTALDAQTLPRVQMPNRDGFVPDPRPELFRWRTRGLRHAACAPLPEGGRRRAGIVLTPHRVRP